jgi:catechol 2,3-dioxygenase-like lactoylglutathione lyase family enzyme
MGHSLIPKIRSNAVARISYMAVISPDPEELKDYYARWFEFQELHRLPNGTIYLTDGTINMGLLKQGADNGEENQAPGLHHLGFVVENLDETKSKLARFDASAVIESRPSSDPFAEIRTTDPEGLIIDISEEGYGVDDAKRVPGIRHIATANDDPGRKFAFYSEVFGMRDVNRDDIIAPQQEGKPASRFAGDGYINFALLTWPVTEPRRGFNHFGVLTPNPHELMYKISEVNPTRLDTRPPDRFAEYRIWDPQGNAIDLSATKGYKVDVDQVDRIA